MIDFIKLEITGIAPEVIKENPILDFHGWVSFQTGEMGKFSRAYYNGLEFKVYEKTIANPKGRITLEGSLHKCWNHGAHNFNDFGAKELAEVISDLRSKFGIEPKQCVLRQVEIGMNISPPVQTKSLLNRCLLHRNRRLEWISTKDEGYYIQARYQRHIVKLYDKKTHYVNQGFKIKEEIFRIEVKYLKMHELNSEGIYTLEDLVKKEFAFYTELLIGQWQKVLLSEEKLVKGKWSTRYNNVNYWMELIDKNRELYKYHRKKYNNLVSNKKDCMKHLITRKIKEKGIILDNSTPQINPLCIGLNKVVSEERTNSHRRFCLVTGLNISMQKPKSILLSHTGLKYYHKTDPKIFNEIKRRFLTEKWENTSLQKQIEEMAHNIRNTLNNKKRQQKRIYHSMQYNLFGESFSVVPQIPILTSFKQELLSLR